MYVVNLNFDIFHFVSELFGAFVFCFGYVWLFFIECTHFLTERTLQDSDHSFRVKAHSSTCFFRVVFFQEKHL